MALGELLDIEAGEDMYDSIQKGGLRTLFDPETAQNLLDSLSATSVPPPEGVPRRSAIESSNDRRMKLQHGDRFDHLDRSNKGTLDQRDYDMAYEPQRLFDRMDKNGDGVIDKQEWMEARPRSSSPIGGARGQGPKLDRDRYSELDDYANKGDERGSYSSGKDIPGHHNKPLQGKSPQRRSGYGTGLGYDNVDADDIYSDDELEQILLNNINNFSV